MQIRIESAVHAPSWVTIEQLIRNCVAEPFSTGRIARIKRIDGGCNYRALGEYLCTYVHNFGTIEVELTVA